MHIEFKRLTLHNFMSFGDSTLEFTDSGFIRVTGINHSTEDMARSNGSGKSSLWEAISWCLTADTIRGTKHIANIHGADGTFVELEFSLDGKSYRLIRAKDHAVYKTSLQIFIDGNDCSGKGIRDSEKLLAEYLPDITPSLIGSVIILGQGLPQKFTNNTPSGRKEVLEKLSKSDFMIDDLKKRVTHRKQELAAALRVTEDDILAIETRKKGHEADIVKAIDLLNSCNKNDLEQAVTDHMQRINSLQDRLDELDVLKSGYDANIESIRESLHKAQLEETHAIQTLSDGYRDTLDGCNKDLYSLKAQIDSLTREINRLKSIKDVCPTCGQKLPEVVKPDTSEQEALRDELQFKAAQAELEFDHITAELNMKKADVQSCYQKVKQDYQVNLDKLMTDKQTCSFEITTITNELKNIREDYHSKSDQLARIETTIQTLEQTIYENNEKIKVCESDLLYNYKQRDLHNNHLEVISKFETALKRDFRGYLLSTVITYIESKAKVYSKIIFDTDRVSFTLAGNNIDIQYCNKAYENLSGGEKQKIDLIIQFAIRDMLSTYLEFTSNILVLDEVFDGLDTLGCQKVIDMIADISDIKNVFIVTHRKDLSIPSDLELIIEKSEEGISRIQ